MNSNNAFITLAPTPPSVCCEVAPPRDFSSSSRRNTHGAHFLTTSIARAIFCSDWPTILSMILSIDNLISGTPNSPANASALIVLEVPGIPKNKAPFGISRPAF